MAAIVIAFLLGLDNVEIGEVSAGESVGVEERVGWLVTKGAVLSANVTLGIATAGGGELFPREFIRANTKLSEASFR